VKDNKIGVKLIVTITKKPSNKAGYKSRTVINSIAHGDAVGYGICFVRDLLTESRSTFRTINPNIENVPSGAMMISVFSYEPMSIALSDNREQSSSLHRWE
jgi:hypothetical protein